MPTVPMLSLSSLSAQTSVRYRYALAQQSVVHNCIFRLSWLKEKIGELESSPTAALQGHDYCSNLVTSCSVLLAWARALMPVWLRISYFERLEVAAGESGAMTSFSGEVVL